jgi:hypothetical protein
MANTATPRKSRTCRIGSLLPAQVDRGARLSAPFVPHRLEDLDRLRVVLLRRLRPLAGTLAPFFRASDKPIAIAWARLFTLPPRPALPLRRVPRLRRRIALLTLLPAPLLYLRPLDLREERFFAAIGASDRKKVE